MNRRAFLQNSLAISALAAATPAIAQQTRKRERNNSDTPTVIASGNGLACVTLVQQLIADGTDPAHAIVQGVAINENDPADNSVGYGGLPNEHGVVSLDACVMHGPTHRSGAVAAIENIKNPAAVALEVARRTDHCMLVGDGAKQFATQLGFKQENLLTEDSRQAWLKWKANHSRNDDWLNEDEFDIPNADSKSTSLLPSPRGRGAGGEGALPPSPNGRGQGEGSKQSRAQRASSSPFPHHTGTIHCSALTPSHDLAGCTTTSGLSWKLPGRIGDSPLIGAGCYTDNNVGSAGATGRGEAVIQTCGARTIVMRMELGDAPKDACLYALQYIADKTKSKRLLNEKNQPNFNVVFYAINKDGHFASACMHGIRDFAIADAKGARLERATPLYD